MVPLSFGLNISLKNLRFWSGMFPRFDLLRFSYSRPSEYLLFQNKKVHKKSFLYKREETSSIHIGHKGMKVSPL